MENKTIWAACMITTAVAAILCLFQTTDDAPFYYLGAAFFGVIFVFSMGMLIHEKKLSKKIVTEKE